MKYLSEETEWRNHIVRSKSKRKGQTQQYQARSAEEAKGSRPDME